MIHSYLKSPSLYFQGFASTVEKTSTLSLGQTDRQVVASGRKLTLHKDLRWVAKRLASFFASTPKSQRKDILRQTILYFIG